MGEINFQSGGGPAAKGSSLGGRIFLVLFATPFAGFGCFAVWDAIKKFFAGNIGEALPIGLFGLVFAAIGFGLMYFSLTAARREKANAAKWLNQTDDGKKIWLARPDWAAGKIKSATGNEWKVFLFMAVMFCGIGGAVSFAALPKELEKGNHLALLVLIFPVIGLGLLFAFVRALLARRRFGDCFFELAQVPAPLGGTLDGLISTGAPLKLEEPLHLELSCIRRTVTQSGKNRTTAETILWQDEKVFRPDASLPATGSGGSGIPVHFNLPADQPESLLRGNPTVVWRLEAKAKMSGPNFSATFEVPVFRVAGAVSVAGKKSDPTAPLQMSAEEIRRDEHSKIQVTDGPVGREFYFPAARNLGTAFALTFFLLIWSGFLALMIYKHAPILFPIVFGLFEIFILWGCFMAWFKSSRVTVNGSGVTLQNRYLIFRRTRQFAADEIVRFDTKVGMTSGTTVFQDLKLITRASQDNMAARKARYPQTGEKPPLQFRTLDPPGVTMASSIASKPEADWLLREMARALGRLPAPPSDGFK